MRATGVLDLLTRARFWHHVPSYPQQRRRGCGDFDYHDNHAWWYTSGGVRYTAQDFRDVFVRAIVSDTYSCDFRMLWQRRLDCPVFLWRRHLCFRCSRLAVTVQRRGIQRRHVAVLRVKVSGMVRDICSRGVVIFLDASTSATSTDRPESVRRMEQNAKGFCFGNKNKKPKSFLWNKYIGKDKTIEDLPLRSPRYAYRLCCMNLGQDEPLEVPSNTDDVELGAPTDEGLN